MAEWTRNILWRQGCLFSDEAIRELGLTHPELPSTTVVIVATHDCDLTQHPDREPHVEIIIGRQISVLDGTFTHAKTSRKLHLKFEGSEPLLAEFVVIEKRSISKEALVNFKPKANTKLSPSDLVTFQLWLAARYRRAAFPDEFEKRLKKAKLHEKIAKAVKPHGEMITTIFFDVDEGHEIARTDPNEVYILDISLLHATEPDFNFAEAAAKTAKAAIERAFKLKLLDTRSGNWKNIELRYIDVISEEALTYRQSRMWKPWRLDYISLAADPQQSVLET